MSQKMPTPTEHFPLPLDLLIGRLEAAGFRVDTSRRLRVLRVFDDLGNPFVGGHFEELKYLLSPLVSRSPQEQERFYEVFDAFWRECEEEAQRVETAGDFAEGEKVVDEVRVLAKPKKWRWWWVSLGLAYAAVYFFLFFSGLTPKYLSFPSYTTEGDTLWASGATVKIRECLILGMSVPDVHSTVHWEVRDSTMRTILHRDTGDLVWQVTEKHGQDMWVFVEIHTSTWLRDFVEPGQFNVKIICSNPPKVSDITPSSEPPYLPDTEYEFSIETEPGCRVVWVWEEINGGSSSDTLTVDATGRSIFRLKTETASKGIALVATVHRPEKMGYCYTERSFDIYLDDDKPILPILPLTPFQRAEGFSVFTISRLGWLLIALPLLFAGWFFYRWRKKRNTPAPQKTPEELADQYPVLDAGPYFIPYRSQEHSITVPREFFRIAELLRRREEGQRRYFDGPATVRATVASGGFPAWRERAVTRPAEYLFLVERPDERDQQGKLFTRLCDFLKRRDVPLVTFFHDGSFGHFWNSEYANGLPPNELRRRYPHHRLVLLGAAHGLVNPYATRQPELLRGPLDWLTHWQRRLLITPEPVAAWSFQEALLHRHFLVFPADTEGILSGIDLLDRTEEYHAGRFEGWQEGRAPRHSPETHRYRTWKTAADHADYLRHDPDCFRWLCALAVCAQPDWSLTLAIGRAIGVEVTHDRLLLLTRIPWLSQNLPNDGLRLDLLRQLSPADEQAARAAVAHELEAVRSVTANSFAETERTANAAVQNFALDPRDEAHKQAIRELRTLGLLSGSQEAELDFIVQEKADKAGLPNSAGAGIEGWLDVPAPKQFLTWDMTLGLLALALSVVLFLALSLRIKPFPAPFEGLTNDVVQSSEVMQLNERAIGIAERVLAVEDYQQWLSLQGEVREADSLFRLVANAGMISVSGGLTKLAQRKNNLGINLPIFRYNVNAKNFNFYQTEGLPADVLRTPLGGFEWAANEAEETSDAGLDALISFKRKFVLDARHGQGLCYYCLSKYSLTQMATDFVKPPNDTSPAPAAQVALLDSARLVYESIYRNSLYPNYFDSIQPTMPVNLETLLEAEKVTEKGDLADTDETLRQKIVGHWLYEEVGIVKVINIFRKDGTFAMQRYDLENNKFEQVSLSKWSVENKTLRLFLDGDSQTAQIIYLDDKRLTMLRGSTYRRIQPTDRDRDGVLDVVDNCPDEKGAAGNAGCPEETKGPKVVVSAVHAVTKAPLYGVTYRLIGEDGKDLQKISTGLGERSVSFRVDGFIYLIVASKDGFEPDSVSGLNKAEDPNSTFTETISLRPKTISEESYPPITLYFDNDQPDPNTNSTSTRQAYQPLYVSYYRRKDEYIKQYTAGLSKEAVVGAGGALENFFEYDVKGGWNRLFQLTEELYTKLERGDRIGLTLRGYTASGAANAYNQNLAKRRISSVVNHFLSFDGGMYKQFVDNGQLTFTQEVKEDSQAPKTGRGSLFSPEAARQRRVEVIVVEIKGKSKN